MADDRSLHAEVHQSNNEGDDDSLDEGILDGPEGEKLSVKDEDETCLLGDDDDKKLDSTDHLGEKQQVSEESKNGIIDNEDKSENVKESDTEKVIEMTLHVKVEDADDEDCSNKEDVLEKLKEEKVQVQDKEKQSKCNELETSEIKEEQHFSSSDTSDEEMDDKETESKCNDLGFFDPNLLVKSELNNTDVDGHDHLVAMCLEHRCYIELKITDFEAAERAKIRSELLEEERKRLELVRKQQEEEQRRRIAEERQRLKEEAEARVKKDLLLKIRLEEKEKIRKEFSDKVKIEEEVKKKKDIKLEKHTSQAACKTKVENMGANVKKEFTDGGNAQIEMKEEKEDALKKQIKSEGKDDGVKQQNGDGGDADIKMKEQKVFGVKEEIEIAEKYEGVKEQTKIQPKEEAISLKEELTYGADVMEMKQEKQDGIKEEITSDGKAEGVSVKEVVVEPKSLMKDIDDKIPVKKEELKTQVDRPARKRKIKGLLNDEGRLPKKPAKVKDTKDEQPSKPPAEDSDEDIIFIDISTEEDKSQKPKKGDFNIWVQKKYRFGDKKIVPVVIPDDECEIIEIKPVEPKPKLEIDVEKLRFRRNRLTLRKLKDIDTQTYDTIQKMDKETDAKVPHSTQSQQTDTMEKKENKEAQQQTEPYPSTSNESKVAKQSVVKITFEEQKLILPKEHFCALVLEVVKTYEAYRVNQQNQSHPPPQHQQMMLQENNPQPPPPPQQQQVMIQQNQPQPPPQQQQIMLQQNQPQLPPPPHQMMIQQNQPQVPAQPTPTQQFNLQPLQQGLTTQLTGHIQPDGQIILTQIPVTTNQNLTDQTNYAANSGMQAEQANNPGGQHANDQQLMYGQANQAQDNTGGQQIQTPTTSSGLTSSNPQRYTYRPVAEPEFSAEFIAQQRETFAYYSHQEQQNAQLSQNNENNAEGFDNPSVTTTSTVGNSTITRKRSHTGDNEAEPKSKYNMRSSSKGKSTKKAKPKTSMTRRSRATTTTESSFIDNSDELGMANMYIEDNDEDYDNDDTADTSQSTPDLLHLKLDSSQSTEASTPRQGNFAAQVQSASTPQAGQEEVTIGKQLSGENRELKIPLKNNMFLTQTCTDSGSGTMVKTKGQKKSMFGMAVNTQATPTTRVKSELVHNVNAAKSAAKQNQPVNMSAQSAVPVGSENKVLRSGQIFGGPQQSGGRKSPAIPPAHGGSKVHSGKALATGGQQQPSRSTPPPAHQHPKALANQPVDDGTPAGKKTGEGEGSNASHMHHGFQVSQVECDVWSQDPQKFFDNNVRSLRALHFLLENLFEAISPGEMDVLLADYDRLSIPPKKDNNSFLHAVVKQTTLYNGGKDLRRAIIQHINNNNLKYQKMIATQTNLGFNEYCSTMLDVKTAYDEIIIIACADILKRNITIINKSEIWQFDESQEADIIVVMAERKHVYSTRPGESLPKRFFGKDIQLVHKCWRCKKKFATIAILNKHKASHQIYRYHCTHCSRLYASPVSLKQHINVMHFGQMYECKYPGCKKKFKTNRSLVDHTKWHELQYKFLCDKCDKGFMRGDHYRVHLLRHERKRPFTCDKCGLSFFRKNELSRHLVATCEDESRQFVRCPICGKLLKNKDTLRYHRNTVHEEGILHVCPYCDLKKSYHPSTIERHLKAHHPDKL